MIKLSRLLKKCLSKNRPSFSDFKNFKLDYISQLKEYFHENLEHNRKLCLNEFLILQRLTDKFRAEYKNVLVVNHQSTTIEE